MALIYEVFSDKLAAPLFCLTKMIQPEDICFCLNIQLSTRIKDACIAIRHSRAYIISILQGPETGWRGLPAMGWDTKRKLYLRKKHLFVINTYIEDILETG